MIIYNVIVTLFDSVSYIRLLFHKYRLGIVRGMAMLKAHPKIKSTKIEYINESSPRKEAMAKKLNTESKVKENQVIDEEIVMRNTIESFHEAVSPIL